MFVLVFYEICMFLGVKFGFYGSNIYGLEYNIVIWQKIK